MFPIISFIGLFLLLITISVIILFQLHLVKMESKWSGLILPITSFIFSSLIIFNISMTDIIELIFIFLLINIPTMVLLAIYFNARKKMNNVTEIKKMTIQDLE